MEDCVQFTQMPLEIQVMILEDLTAKDFARLSAVNIAFLQDKFKICNCFCVLLESKS